MLPTTSARCVCDACVAVKTPTALWTLDGYCDHCAQYCHLPMVIDGKFSRASHTREARLDIHRRLSTAPAPAGHAQTPPAGSLPPVSIEGAMAAIKNPNVRFYAEAALRLSDYIVPELHPVAKKVWRAVRGARGRR